MRSFFKFLLASVLGNMVAFFIAFLLIFVIAIGIVSTLENKISERDLDLKDNSILVLNFNKPIIDQGSESSDELDELFEDLKLGLNQIVESITRAKDDDRISGILFKADGYRAGLATTEEIRNALKDFKSSNKFIYSYAENYGQLGYYLASVSDSIFMYPEGSLELKGFSSQYPFFKGLLDKLNIDVQVIRGPGNKYKSAVEPFILSQMSEENKHQIRELLGDVWQNMLNQLAIDRKIGVETIDSLAQNYLIRTPQDGLNQRLVDGTKYYDEILDLLKKRLTLSTHDKINSIGISDYGKVEFSAIEKSKRKKEDHGAKSNIGIIYASGDIVSGTGSDDNIGSEKLSRVIRKVRQDSTIKAVVLRINSPGGSALASDVIWREVKLTSKVKPIVVSMGDLAASGGYYIASAADKIVCQPTTITGSIGVFGLLPNLGKFMNNKLGISFDTVKTNKYADIGTFTRKLRADELEIIQSSVDTIYSKFIQKVAEGRGMHPNKVNELAQGRVWSGIEAYHIGLADELGGLNEAIKSAAELASLENYKTSNYPKKKSRIEKIFSKLGNENETKVIHNYLMKYSEYKTLNSLKLMLEDPHPQARLLLNFEF